MLYPDYVSGPTIPLAVTWTAASAGPRSCEVKITLFLGRIRLNLPNRRERLIRPERKVPARRLASAECCAQAYEQHFSLGEARGLATVTVINYLPLIRSFLKDRFGSGVGSIIRLCGAPELVHPHMELISSVLG